MSAKPTELKRLINLMEQEEYSSVEEAAKILFNAVEDMLWEREQYVVVVQHYDKIAGRSELIQTFGPFANRERAAKEAEKRVRSIGGTVATQWRVAQLRHYDVYNK